MIGLWAIFNYYLFRKRKVTLGDHYAVYEYPIFQLLKQVTNLNEIWYKRYVTGAADVKFGTDIDYKNAYKFSIKCS
jgi:hypothetical protein